MTIQELEKDADELRHHIEKELDKMNKKYKGFVFDIDLNNIKAISGEIKTTVLVSARQET